jgi:hypothetical protein
MAHPAISQVIERVGLSELAKALTVSYQAIRKWEAAGRLPRTEWTGETSYAQRMSALTGGEVSVDALLARHVADVRPTGAGVAPTREAA